MARILMISCLTFVFLLGETVGLSTVSNQQPAKKTNWSGNFTWNSGSLRSWRVFRGEPRERDAGYNGGVKISLKWVCDGEDDCGDGSNTETAYHSSSASLRFSEIKIIRSVMSDGFEYKAVTNLDSWDLGKIYWVDVQDPLLLAMPRSIKEHPFNMDYSVKWVPEIQQIFNSFEPVFVWKGNRLEHSTRDVDGDDANYYLIGHGKITLDQSDGTLVLYKTGSDAFEIGFKAIYPNESRHNAVFYLPSYHSYSMDSFEDHLFWKDIVKSDETEKEFIIAAQCKKMGLKILTPHEERLGDTCYQGSGDLRDHICLFLLHAEKPEFSRLEESRLKVNKQAYQNNKEERLAEKPWDPIALLALISMLLLQGIKKVAIYLPGTKVTKLKGQTGGVVVVGDYTTVNNYHYHHQFKW